VHPGRLAAIPISQNATADQACVKVRSARLTDLDEIIRINTMIVIDEGQDPALNEWDSAIQSVGFACNWLRYPTQGYPVPYIRLIPIRLQDFRRVVRARVGDYKQLDVATRRAGSFT